MLLVHTSLSSTLPASYHPMILSTHLSLSKKLKEYGIKITVIFIAKQFCSQVIFKGEYNLNICKPVKENRFISVKVSYETEREVLKQHKKSLII
jgi:hypothetical protein